MSDWNGFYIDDETGRAHRAVPYEDPPMTNPMTRYRLNSTLEEMAEDPDGEYVRYEDYVALLGRLSMASLPVEPPCTCVQFTQTGATVTQHWKDDPQCPVHGGRISAAASGLTLTGLPAEPDWTDANGKRHRYKCGLNPDPTAVKHMVAYCTCPAEPTPSRTGDLTAAETITFLGGKAKPCQHGSFGHCYACQCEAESAQNRKAEPI